jgi:hypothetical protein
MEKWTVGLGQLKSELKKRGALQRGKKAVLLERFVPKINLNVP